MENFIDFQTPAWACPPNLLGLIIALTRQGGDFFQAVPQGMPDRRRTFGIRNEWKKGGKIQYLFPPLPQTRRSGQIA